MPVVVLPKSPGSLCFIKLGEENLISNETIKSSIKESFLEHRAFPFYPIQIKNKNEWNNSIIKIRNSSLDFVAGSNSSLRRHLSSDFRLCSLLDSAINLVHLAIEKIDIPQLFQRRYVIISEKHGNPSFCCFSKSSVLISHVGQGPYWTEIPTIYLSLKIFEIISSGFQSGEKKFFETLIDLLLIEERAIETGYSHLDPLLPKIAEELEELAKESIRILTTTLIEPYRVFRKKKIRKFGLASRKSLIEALDARLPNKPFDFDIKKNIEAIEKLETLARGYKKNGDIESLKEVVRILVAASGHDVHEVRNRANIILERIFSPKEFDAPLSTTFITKKVGEKHIFEFILQEKRGPYFIRIYRNPTHEEFSTENNLDFVDIDLQKDSQTNKYRAEIAFNEIGSFDFLVFRKKKKGIEWVKQEGFSGRINVIPKVAGQIILEIFPDIHGHTQIYWMEDPEHPGLVYNENGEIIRTGRFSDITNHLESLKNRYHITAIYLLGIQKRGSNREDWAPGATSPSPFAPMSLTEIDEKIGGKEEFIQLVKKAHELDIKIIVDLIPHLNRKSKEVPEQFIVKCFDDSGNLVFRASTDGRYGSWNDGMLINYRKFEMWEWLCKCATDLIEKYDIDGIRFDSAHAMPIMMKKNNTPVINGFPRTHEEMVEGSIILNDRQDGHFITTGFYDCECRETISIPFHHFFMTQVEKKLREKKKNFFLNIAECYWGHERFLTRCGIIPYNSALFKICEEIIHGKSDVREIYHLYDNYYKSALPPGTELLGILGNHDERRALNTFGHRGLRAAVALTIFMNNIILDYEGSAEGESWKVFLDNIYVNWNSFEYASHRSVERFYEFWYRFHRENSGKSYLLWANNNMVASAIKFTDKRIIIGAFNFSNQNEYVSIQFDNPSLPIEENALFRLIDPLYSPITGKTGTFTGKELKTSKIHTVVSFTERVKLLELIKIGNLEENYEDFLRDSFFRLCTIDNPAHINSNFAFLELVNHSTSFKELSSFIQKKLIPIFWEVNRQELELGLKRAFFYLVRNGYRTPQKVLKFIEYLTHQKNLRMRQLGEALKYHNSRGPLVFMSAEAEPFSKAGGLGNVVYELPRELAKMGEEVYLITPLYKHGDFASTNKIRKAIEKYKVTYTGKNVKFKIREKEYEVGVHYGEVDGIKVFLLDHHEFFDGLYWGYTAEEKLIRRIAFARACAEVICTFGLHPHFTFTNDAFAGLFNGITRSDHVYRENPNFKRTTFLHVIHNGGWQYFDAYDRWQNFDIFDLFNLPHERYVDFSDPNNPNRINCMATGIRFADRVITVSPSYARQIEVACDGLEKILHNVIGISNAISQQFEINLKKRFEESGFLDEWYVKLIDKILGDSKLQEKITTKFPEILRGPDFLENIQDEIRKFTVRRTAYKLMLQLQRGLKVDPDKILFTMIHRITEQKGFQLLLEASQEIFTTLGFQGIIGGSVAFGDSRGEEILRGLELLTHYYPDSVSLKTGYQDISAPLLCSDVFLMPSLSEPGGIAQLEALSAGCLVIARATGGLRDTIQTIRISENGISGNGFLFSDFTPYSFLDAMKRCKEFFEKSDEKTIYMARMNAKKSVFFWDKPAREYLKAIYDIKEVIRII